MDFFYYFASVFTLVVSVLVAGYAVVYSWILWDESKHGEDVRKDWNISLYFYAGIFLAVAANLLGVLDDLYGGDYEYFSPFLHLAALVFLFIGFRKRMRQDVK